MKRRRLPVSRFPVSRFPESPGPATAGSLPFGSLSARSIPLVAIVLIAVAATGGCNPLLPRPIEHDGYRVAPELAAWDGARIQRGKERPIIDTVGWVVGVPGRCLLWDPRIDNHHITPATEAAVAEYMAWNGLDHVAVRLNQYAPLEDWRRLRANKTVGWGYRYTLGTLSVLGEAIFPGRIFGGDHYNPFTATVHVTSDVPSIALHEAAHAKDFARREYPGTYALIYLVPILPLWHEREATSEVFAYVESRGDPGLREEAYRILYPAYGTYVGSSLGWIFPRYTDPLYVGSVVTGHFAGHRAAIEIERETRRGVLSTETRRGVLSTETRRGVLSTETRPGVLSREARRGILSTETGGDAR